MTFRPAGLGPKKTCPWLKKRSASTKQKKKLCLPALLVIALHRETCILPVAFCEVDKVSEFTRDLKYDDLQADVQHWLPLLSDDFLTAKQLLDAPMLSWRIIQLHAFRGDVSYSRLSDIWIPCTPCLKM